VTDPGEASLVPGGTGEDGLGALGEGGVSYRALIMPSFMDNLLSQVPAIKSQGAFFLPVAGDRKLPACATRDIAAAARLLLDDSWTGTGSVPVLGPEDLPFNDMAQIISQALGQPVHYEPRTPAGTTPTTFRQWCEEVLRPAVLA
jgi:uncharacterized protein YbjT (DUF2867 family)